MISVASDYLIALTTLKKWFGLLGRPSVYYLPTYLCMYVHMLGRVISSTDPLCGPFADSLHLTGFYWYKNVL